MAANNNLNVKFTLIRIYHLPLSSSAVCSSTTSISSKYDPELLKADLAVSKERVRRLKQELAQINSEISFTQRGVATLYE